ncbi:MAG: DUF4258 domain-containing protein [Acidobacteriaceae bacterium]
MDCSSVHYSRHAIERMFQRSLSPAAIAAVLQASEVIAGYPEDIPYPSQLLLGFVSEQPVHVVLARDPETGACFVVTVYRPDPQHWEQDYKTRRQS